MLVALLASACGADVPTGDGVQGSEDGEAESRSAQYTVTLGNALTDTLAGRAHFGIVYETQSRSERFVIRLASTFDFAGGVVLARRDTTLPDAGTYALDARHDSLAADEDFILLYREGMLRDMRASSGTLNLISVTDTLIVGTFDAQLRGRVAFPDRVGGAEVHAVGRFRASPNLDGFVIGL